MNSDETILIQLSKTGKHKGKYETIVSLEDSDLDKYGWHVSTAKNTKYVKRRDTVKNGRKIIYLHRVILERMLDRPLKRGETVDHINGNGLDNRRSNLRLATIKQNNRNVKKRSDNSSGYKGVTWCKRSKRWIAQITIAGKHKHIGAFKNKKEAHEAYCKTAKEYFGEFFNSGE